MPLEGFYVARSLRLIDFTPNKNCLLSPNLIQSLPCHPNIEVRLFWDAPIHNESSLLSLTSIANVEASRICRSPIHLAELDSAYLHMEHDEAPLSSNEANGISVLVTREIPTMRASDGESHYAISPG